MFFASTGGIFLRIDANANLGIFDQAGTERVVIANGILSGNLNKGTAVQNSPITTTTSLVGVSLGTGSTITPQVSGNILIFSGQATLANGTASDGGFVNVFRVASASIPAGGAAPTGAGITGGSPQSSMTNNANTAALAVPATIIGIDVNAVIGTKYSYYYVGGSLTGGTTTFGALSQIFTVEI